ncbi:hypothetical protein SARC_01940 [Sphaeroforma arctica JP610]|uniref:Rab-GAP TBC domain-containing protein n=1 Tax=Sphaeroforma arctica JP610 TaxID=667725 RepID=A0A0L0GA40_9EUKA|nr:hypothetical protein SARC_01940 [Sphaeroforma arctica JP610]KNC85902.1 hypothetical protein SARC_01940 [Sphaeroforma arctica JP610]|eukprot:XP_014159804.1 hypothetical protein SARC_01940 [Sphaeroforma arctica JP610]
MQSSTPSYIHSTLPCDVPLYVHELIAERLPALTEHFKANDVDIGPLITPWLLTVFVIDTRTHVMFRIWDAFLLEGVKVLIRVVLAIFTIHEQHLLTVTGSDDLFVRIKQLPGETTDGDELMQVAFGLKKFKWQHIQQKRITLFQQWSQ